MDPHFNNTVYYWDTNSKLLDGLTKRVGPIRADRLKVQVTKKTVQFKRQLGEVSYKVKLITWRGEFLKNLRKILG